MSGRRQHEPDKKKGIWTRRRIQNTFCMVRDTKFISSYLDLFMLLVGYERDPYFNRYYVVDKQRSLKLLVLYDINGLSFVTMRFVLDVTEFQDRHQLLMAVPCAENNPRVYDLVRRLRHLLLDAESRKRWTSPHSSGD